MRVEYHLTDDGELLDPATTDPATYGSASRRWIVQSLPDDHAGQHQLQQELMNACGMTDATSDDADALAAAVLHHPGSTAVFPDDVVAIRVALLTLTGDEDRPVSAAHVHIVSRHTYTVTTSDDDDALQRLIKRMHDLPSQRRTGDFTVLRTALGMVLEDGAEIVDHLGNRTARLEDAVFASSQPDDDVVEEIYAAKRLVAEVRRHLLPVINRLEYITDDGHGFSQQTADQLARITAGMHRFESALETDDRLLGDILNAQLAIVQVQQNNDMRRISAYGALITVPTLIAGIYGMNFEHMPELIWQWGYPLCLVVMTGVVLWMRALFKRSGWL